jgi:nucleoside 2-deoxyribosyltransferase
MARIFLSGPMFDGADLWEQGQIKDVLVKAGYDTYLAAEDGIEDAELVDNLHSPLLGTSAFQTVSILVQKLGWTLDIYMATYGCDGMVFNMNGRVPDEGSVAEVANAYAAGMPIVTFKSTSITMWGPFDNPMVAALNRTWHPTTTYDAIPAAMATALAARDASYSYVAPPYFAKSLEIGKYVHDNRDEIMTALLAVSREVNKAGHDIGSLWKLLLSHLDLAHLATELNT